MERLLQQYKILETVVYQTDIIPQEYASTFLKKTLILPEDELDTIIQILYSTIHKRNIEKRRNYLKRLNIENKFLAQFSH